MAQRGNPRSGITLLLILIFAMLGSARVAQSSSLSSATLKDGLLTVDVVAVPGEALGGWRLGSSDRFEATGDFDGDGFDDLLVTSDWGIGILGKTGGRWRATAMVKNGTSVDGWNFQSRDSHIEGIGDFDGDGADDILITSPWGMTILELVDGDMSALMIKPDNTRFGAWRYTARAGQQGDVVVAIADLDGDARDEIVISGKTGVAVLKLRGDTLRTLSVVENGTSLDGWNFQSHDNRFETSDDFNGDGRDELLVSSDWGVAVLALENQRIRTIAAAQSNSWLGRWRLNAAINQSRDIVEGSGDLDGDGVDEIVLSSSWGIGILKLQQDELVAVYVQRTTSHSGLFFLNTKTQRFREFVDLNADGQQDLIVGGRPSFVVTLSDSSDSLNSLGKEGSVFDTPNLLGGTFSISGPEVMVYHPAPLKGIADLHTHPMSHLGFGKKALHGAPDIGSIVPAGTSGGHDADRRATSMADALGNCNPTHGGWGTDNGKGDHIRAAIINHALDKNFVHKVPFEKNLHGDHAHPGYPQFAYWPHQSSILHQQMWVDWIERAHKGGLRVMVALAVNNELLGELLLGDDPKDDKTVADLQIAETIAFVERHEFMQIARTPEDLRRIVHADKLAVVLGMEVDNLGNFNKTAATPASVAAELQRLHHLGVRYIFPVHLVDNAFGGAAVYDPLFNVANRHSTGDYYEVESDSSIGYRANITDGPVGFENGILLGARSALNAVGSLPPPPGDVCFDGSNPFSSLFTCQPFPPGRLRCCGHFRLVSNLIPASSAFDVYKLIPGGHVNRKGLSPLGKFALLEMMKLGMMIDVDHMSQKTVNDALELAELYRYPLNSGHNGVRGPGGSERALTEAQYGRIGRLQGVVGLGTKNKTPDFFVADYNKLWLAVGGNGVGVGTDVNGFEPLPKSQPGRDYTDFYRDFDPETVLGRRWDYPTEGVAHYGLMADFFRDLDVNHAASGVTYRLNQSAEFFARAWETSKAQSRTIH